MSRSWTAASRDGEPLRELVSHPDAVLLVHLCVAGPSSRPLLASLWPGDDEERRHALEETRVVRRVAGADVLIEEAGHLRCADGAVRCEAGRMGDAEAAPSTSAPRSRKAPGGASGPGRRSSLPGSGDSSHRLS